MKNILQANTLAEIQTRLQALKPENKALWGKMTVHQMLAHCSDQFRMIFGEIQPKKAGSFFHRTALKWLVLYVIKAPKGKVQTLPELAPELGGSQPITFEQDRQTLLDYIQRFVDQEQATLFPHGAFGKLTRKEWARMIYSHLDHHFEQFGV